MRGLKFKASQFNYEIFMSQRSIIELRIRVSSVSNITVFCRGIECYFSKWADLHEVLLTLV